MTRPFYLLVDTSGSTVRHGFNAGWNQALPQIADAVEEIAGPEERVCILTYGDDATLRVPLTRVRDLTVLPMMAAGGLSCLATGIRLLARVLREDRDQLISDDIPVDAPTVLVVADGTGTDDAGHLLAARDLLDGQAPTVHVAFPDHEELLPFAALRAVPHPVRVGDAERTARSITTVVRAVLLR